MKIELTKDTLIFIVEALKKEDRECSWELAVLPPQHKTMNTVTYQYWVCKQVAIKKALKELGVHYG